MKRLLIVAFACCICNGCCWVPNDFMGKMTWCWSKEARLHHEEHEAEEKAIQEYQRTNHVVAPLK